MVNVLADGGDAEAEPFGRWPTVLVTSQHAPTTSFCSDGTVHVRRNPRSRPPPDSAVKTASPSFKLFHKMMIAASRLRPATR